MAMIDQLSEYPMRARTEELPQEVARKGKHHILGTLADLSTQQIRWALSYAAQQASGVRSWVADNDYIEKALHLMVPVLGEAQAEELVAKISRLESLATARELGSLLKIKKQN